MVELTEEEAGVGPDEPWILGQNSCVRENTALFGYIPVR